MRFALLALSFALPAATLGCGDPVPPNPKAAWSVTFIDGGPEGAQGCALSGHNQQVGDVTATTKNALVDNGVDGADVSCEVTGSGSFNVNGSAFQGGANLTISVSGLKPKGPTKDAPVKGTVAFASPTTSGESYSTTSEALCNFYFAENSNQDVAAGRVWISFDCPEIVRETSRCSLGDSYAIFENCGGASEEDE